MAIQNKDFRVKNGLYVGTGIDVLRGAVSALSAHIGGGYGDTGVTISSIGDLSANGIGVFDGNVLIGGGYGDTGITLTNTGNLSANGDVVIDGNLSIGSFSTSVADTQIFYSNSGDLTGNAGLTFDGTTLRATALSATTLSGSGTALTTNFTLSAGGDVDDATVNVTALNGTYSLNLELTNVLTTSPGSYGSQTSFPTFVVDEDGRLTSAAEVDVATTLSTAGDSTTGDVDLLTETLSVIGTANEIETAASNNVITIGLPNDVTITGDLTVNGNDINDSSGSSAITFDGSRNTTAQGNLTVVGDFTVNGNTTTQNVSTVLVEDPVIKLANGNSADSLDIGFYGEYVGVGTSKYAGLIRDVTFAGGNKPFVFFDGTETDILSANASGSGKPGLSNFADVYMGRIGINTTDYNSSNRLTVAGDISASGDSAAYLAGGYGTTGVTISSGGNVSANGNLIIDGTSTLTGEVQIGGGYGSTGITLTDTGNISADGSFTVGSFYADEIFIGGGYGDTGVTITSTGAISADGGIFADAFYSKTGGSAIDFNDSIDLNGTFTFSGGLSAGTTNSVIIENSGLLQKRDINSRVWGTTLVDNNNVSGTTNRLTKWTDADSIVDSRISDDATDIVIGVGGTNPVTFTASSSATSVTYNDTTGYHSLSAVVNATCINLPIFTKPATEFRSGKIVVQSVLGTTQYEVAELLLIHDGTDVHVTEYGNISTAATFCTSYSADIDSGNVRILATNAHTSVNAVVTTAVQQFLI